MSDNSIGPENVPGKKQPLKDPFKVPKAHGAMMLQLTWQSFNEASRRSRWILIVMVTASIVFFTAYWNSLPHSWIRSRSQVLYDVLLYRAYDPTETYNEARHKKIDRARFNQLQDFCIQRHLTLRAVDVSIPGAEETTEEQQLRGRLERMLQSRDAIYNEQVLLLTIPFFGASVDLNDIGVMGGITLTILMVMYWFSLSRERDSLFYAMERGASRVSIARIYPLISSAQVLEVPRGLSGRRVHPLRRWMNKVLSMPPVLVQAAIVSHDFKTWGLGSSVEYEATKSSLALSCAALVAILVLTVLVFDVHREISGLWMTAYKKAKKKIKKWSKQEKKRRERELQELIEKARQCEENRRKCGDEGDGATTPAC